MNKAAKKRRPSVAQLDTLHPLVMVVDDDLGIHELNDPARRFFGPAFRQVLRQRAGNVFHCAHHRENPEGCGRGRFCQICPIREAAVHAAREQQVVRRRTKAEIGDADQAREVHLLVTATPLPSRPKRVLLVLEDITALMALQYPVPICAACKRIRDDHHYWAEMEVHVRKHFDLEMSQGLCPDCKKQLFRIAVGPHC